MHIDVVVVTEQYHHKNIMTSRVNECGVQRGEPVARRGRKLNFPSWLECHLAGRGGGSRCGSCDSGQSGQTPES